jgi:hypothetical protein
MLSIYVQTYAHTTEKVSFCKETKLDFLILNIKTETEIKRKLKR